MIFRVGFLLVALVSAVTVGQTNLFRGRRRSSSSSHKHGNARFCGGRRTGKEDSRFDASHEERRRGNEEKAETCRSESALEGISDKPENFDSKMEISTVQENSVHEINHLKEVVKEMEQRRENLELGLIELYCLKEQNSRISYLQKELKDKIVEIDILTNVLNKLQSEREVLYKEVKLNQLTEKQLESARLELLELQLKMEFDVGRMNEHLVKLKEQVCRFFDMDEMTRKDTKSYQKLRDKRKVELEAMKMKRRNKVLQMEKRELGVKLDSVQARILELSNMTQNIIVARIEEEKKRLKGDNHHLTEKIEELHKNRFSILEELVYQRRLYSCLRFEVQDHQSRKVCKKLSFQSEDESRSFSELSSTDGGSDEFTNTTTSCSSSPSVTKSKKLFSQIFKIKKWGSNDFSPDVKNRSFGRKKPGLFRRFSMSSVVLSSNSGERNKEIRGGPDSNSPETPLIRGRVRRVSFNDSLNSVAYIREIENSDQSIIANAGSFNDWSDIKTSSSLASTNTQEKKTEETASEEPKNSFSGDLKIINQDFHSSISNNNKEIKTEIELNLSFILSFSIIIFLFIYIVYYFRVMISQIFKII